MDDRSLRMLREWVVAAGPTADWVVEGVQELLDAYEAQVSALADLEERAADLEYKVEELEAEIEELECNN